MCHFLVYKIFFKSCHITHETIETILPYANAYTVAFKNEKHHSICSQDYKNFQVVKADIYTQNQKISKNTFSQRKTL